MARNTDSTKVELKIPDYIDKPGRDEIARRVVEFIRERTEQGLSVYNRPWAGKAGEYSKSYGKDPPVDLEASGKMLNALKQIKGESGPGKIVVGYHDSSNQRAKAEGNILGTYGQPAPIPGKARPFVDILKKDLDNIVEDYLSEAERQRGT
jgi:hypothetical protein